MSYLDCAQYDCCHNKAGCCCLDGINVRHTGPGDAVCGSYRNSEGYGNVATDNQPASPETDIHCDDKGCRHLEGRCCCADHARPASLRQIPFCGSHCRGGIHPSRALPAAANGHGGQRTGRPTTKTASPMGKPFSIC